MIRKLLNIINNLTISVKVGLMLFIPLVSLGAVLVDNLQRESRDLEEVVISIEVVNWITELGDLIYSLAIERGLSIAMLSGERVEINRVLLNYREKIDLQRDRFHSIQKQLELSIKDPTVQQILSDFDLALSRLSTVRQQLDQADSGTRQAMEVYDYYSFINSNGLHLVQEVIQKVRDGDMERQLRVVSALLWIKERAGQERAVLTRIFSMGELAPRLTAEANFLIQDQENHLRSFMRNATQKQRNTLNQLMEGAVIDEVSHYRELFLVRMEKLEVMSRLRALIGYGGMIHLFKNRVLRSDTLLEAEIAQLHQQAQSIIDSYWKLEGVTEVELEALSKVEETLDDYQKKVEKVVSMLKSGVSSAEIDQMVQVDDSSALEALEVLDQQILHSGVDSNGWFQSATLRIERLKQATEIIQSSLRDQVEIESRNARWSYLFDFSTKLLIILMSALVALYLGHHLHRRIQQSVVTIDRIRESGDLSIRIEIESKDEIGRMGTALNELFQLQQQAIQGAIRVSHGVAVGDYSCTIEEAFQGDLDQLKQGINGSILMLKENAEKLSAQYSEMDQILGSMDQGLIVTDLAGKIERVNPKWLGLSGFSSEQMVGRDWKEFLEGANDLGALDSLLSVVDQLHNLIQDQSALEALCEETQIASMVVDPHGRVVAMNSQMEWLSDWSAEQLVGESFEQLIPPDFRQSHAEMVRAYYRDPKLLKMGRERTFSLYTREKQVKQVEVGLVPIKLQQEQWIILLLNEHTNRRQQLLFEQSHFGQLLEGQVVTRQCTLNHQSGKKIPVQVSSTALNSIGGEAVGAVLGVNALRERIRAEQKEQYVAFQAGIADLGASVIHNIGNAVTGMNGNLSQLANVGKLVTQLQQAQSDFAQQLSTIKAEETAAPQLQEKLADTTLLLTQSAQMLGKVAGEVERGGQGALAKLESTIHHIREIITIQKSKTSVTQHASEFNLQLMVDDTLHLLGDRIGTIRFQITMRLPPAQQELFLPRNPLMQQLLNLLKNSVEAISEELHSNAELKGEITLSMEPSDESGFLMMLIGDNGCGHAPEAMERLFKPRYTTKLQGSGYGLHSAANFVNSIGGSLTANSEGLHQGMEMVIKLPYRLSDENHF